jgi:hypothetical protein
MEVQVLLAHKDHKVLLDLLAQLVQAAQEVQQELLV